MKKLFTMLYAVAALTLLSGCMTPVPVHQVDANGQFIYPQPQQGTETVVLKEEGDGCRVTKINGGLRETYVSRAKCADLRFAASDLTGQRVVVQQAPTLATTQNMMDGNVPVCRLTFSNKAVMDLRERTCESEETRELIGRLRNQTLQQTVATTAMPGGTQVVQPGTTVAVAPDQGMTLPRAVNDLIGIGLGIVTGSAIAHFVCNGRNHCERFMRAAGGITGLAVAEHNWNSQYVTVPGGAPQGAPVHVVPGSVYHGSTWYNHRPSYYPNSVDRAYLNYKAEQATFRASRNIDSFNNCFRVHGYNCN